MIVATFEGMAAAVSVSRGGSSRTAGGSAVVQIEGTGQLSEESEGFVLKTPFMGRIERPEFDYLRIDERLTLPDVQGQPSSVLFGPAAANRGSRAMSVELTLKRNPSSG